MSNTRYVEGIGRRKSATARVRITPATKTDFSVNDKDVNEYFVTEEMRKIVREALAGSGVEQNFNISVHVNGSGIHSQAEAVRHGLSRALVDYNLELRSALKKIGFLKRDPRRKERKKFGLKKARKSPTWSKR